MLWLVVILWSDVYGIQEGPFACFTLTGLYFVLVTKKAGTVWVRHLFSSCLLLCDRDLQHTDSYW